MKEYIRDFVQKYDYPNDAIDALWNAYDAAWDKTDFPELVKFFYAENHDSRDFFEKAVDKIALGCSQERYTLYLLYLICVSNELKSKYEEKGIDEEIFWDTMSDLRYKLFECYEIEKVWGIIPFASWFYGLFHMRVFKLGRMEYNLGPFRGESADVAGITVNEGDMVLHIHIPSSGEPFDLAARIESYEKAYNFYRRDFGEKTPVFCCETWLLNPENKTVLGEKSNIASFVDDFKIIETHEYPDNRNMWRIFGADADLPPSQLPRNTSLQRKIADWIEKGNRLGGGKGLFVYDPINKKTLK